MKSDRWKPVQNQQAFEFFDRFVRAGEMTMEVAGALSGGRRVFALARLKDGFHLTRAKEDVTESYLLFTNPHIYGQSVDIRFTPVRVVCHNTLTLALGQEGGVGSGDGVRQSCLRCGFRAKPITHSDSSRSPIPDEPDHRFRSQADHFSAMTGIVPGVRSDGARGSG